MSIISKFKGDKKAEDKKKDGGKNKENAQNESRPANPTRKTWTAEDMRQTNRTAERIGLSRSRSNGSHSVRSSRHRMGRTSSGLSQEWTPSDKRSSASSIKMSRNASFQGLSRVMEDDDSNTILPYDIPPMPAIPSRYSGVSLASSSKPRMSRSPLSVGSSTGQSALSSFETSPVDSEESSNSSNCSNDILEMRSHPFSRPEQFVFHKSESQATMDSDMKGKGKAPIYTMSAPSESYNGQHEQNLQARPERKYFTKASPTGIAVSEFDNTARDASTLTTEKPKAPKAAPVKKNRFSFLKKSEVAV